MKIKAQGANRRVYTHTVVDSVVSDVIACGEKIEFSLLSKMDPGIGSGQYLLDFSLSRAEVFELFDAAMRSEANAEIEDLKKELDELKRQLKNLR